MSNPFVVREISQSEIWVTGLNPRCFLDIRVVIDPEMRQDLASGGTAVEDIAAKLGAAVAQAFHAAELAQPLPMAPKTPEPSELRWDVVARAPEQSDG